MGSTPTIRVDHPLLAKVLARIGLQIGIRYAGDERHFHKDAHTRVSEPEPGASLFLGSWSWSRQNRAAPGIYMY